MPYDDAASLAAAQTASYYANEARRDLLAQLDPTLTILQLRLTRIEAALDLPPVDWDEVMRKKQLKAWGKPS